MIILDGKLDLILQRLPRASPVLHIEENTLNAPLLDVQQKATMKEYQSKRKIQFRNEKDIIEEKDWKFNVSTGVVAGVVTLIFQSSKCISMKMNISLVRSSVQVSNSSKSLIVNNKQGQELINLGFILYIGALLASF